MCASKTNQNRDINESHEGIVKGKVDQSGGFGILGRDNDQWLLPCSRELAGPGQAPLTWSASGVP